MSGNHINVIISISLLSVFLFLYEIKAQSSEEINSLTEEFFSTKLNSGIASSNDSILVKNLLKKVHDCIENRNDSALYWSDQTILHAKKAGLISYISEALQLKGQFFVRKENFEQASACFISALKIEEKLDNKKRIAELNDELGAIYYYEEIFSKSLFYNEKAFEIYALLNDTLGQAKSLSHLASLHMSREYCENRTAEQIKTDKETALNYYNHSLSLYEMTGFKSGVSHLWLNIGNLYRRMGQPEKALGFVEKALDYYRQTNDLEKVSTTLNTMALVYNRLSKSEFALNCLIEAEEIAKKENITDGIQFLYETISQTYDNLKDYKNARDYYVKYMILRDSIYSKEKSQQIFELETKYQTEKKQNEIENLNLIKKQRTFVIYYLIGSLLLVLFLGYTIFRNLKNKKIIADQQLEIKEKQLQELEKERQLTAARSVLKGEEAERSRLAGDLHDGLGSMLTGVKLKLSSMKENSIITSENLEHFTRALDLLDTSISEMRRVAHNLMPETLVHYGLQTALHDFAKQITIEGLPKISFNSFGKNLRFNSEIEITAYRITQELVNNAIKHAAASQIDLQLFLENERICVQVIDNGIGFNPEKQEDFFPGKGLKNISDRVAAFNGRFEILSEPGKGTECTIEFFIT